MGGCGESAKKEKEWKERFQERFGKDEKGVGGGRKAEKGSNNVGRNKQRTALFAQGKPAAARH